TASPGAAPRGALRSAHDQETVPGSNNAPLKGPAKRPVESLFPGDAMGRPAGPALYRRHHPGLSPDTCPLLPAVQVPINLGSCGLLVTVDVRHEKVHQRGDHLGPLNATLQDLLQAVRDVFEVLDIIDKRLQVRPRD